MNGRMVRTAGRALMLAIGLLLLIGCSSGPRMSGLPLGGTRLFSVGDMIELRLPLTDSGGRKWRVTSYDSLYVSGVSTQVVAGPDGSPELLVRARAKTPGTTKVVVEETPVAGRAPRRETFTVRILE